MGVSWELFWTLNPRKIKAIAKGYRRRQEERDRELWATWGNYGVSAMMTALDRCIHGKSTINYMEKPISSMAKTADSGNKDNEFVAVAEMKLRTKILEKQGLPRSPE